jgi:hypothetical protein
MPDNALSGNCVDVPRGTSRRRWRALLLAAAASLLIVAPARADEGPLLRIFLLDGTALASFGEYSRVGGRIVFSMPLGEVDGAPRLQLVSLPDAQVDWARTERYRASARSLHYAVTQGEQDFALLTGEVAAALNEIALTGDPERRLDLAERVRRQLADWPSQHYGYRAREVREIAALLDEAISEFRAAAGGNQFDLNLVAAVEPPAPELMLPAPTPAELVAQALAAADLADVPAERLSLLRGTIAFIDGLDGKIDDGALRRARAHAETRVADEIATDRAYAGLARDATQAARSRAAHADVHGVQRVISSVESRDARLGQRRPAEVRSLLAALRDQLDAARRLRLARDRWRLRVSTYRSYERLIKAPLQQLKGLEAALEDIRTLAGPDAGDLGTVRARAETAAHLLDRIVPPADLAPVHALLQSACHMAGSAAGVRLDAVQSGEMSAAWNASAAAAGSLMLLGRAQDELQRYLAPPQVR